MGFSNFIKLVCICAFMMFGIYSCSDINLSDMSQITREQQKCNVNKQISQKYQQTYGSYFKGNSIPQAFDALSNVPEEYFKWVFGKHRMPVQICGLDGTLASQGCNPGERGAEKAAGLTWLSRPNYGSEQRIPERLMSTVWALPHEFGHASFGAAQEWNQSFFTDLKPISNLIWQKYQAVSSQYLNMYSPYNTQTSSARLDETIAELFDTWYCSETARSVLKSGMPEVYEFAHKYFLPPLDSKEAGENGGISGNSGVKIFVQSQGESFANIFLVADSKLTSFCIGSKTLCEQGSTKKKLDSLRISSSLDGYRISSINPASITESNPLHIYSDSGLVRSLYFSRR